MIDFDPLTVLGSGAASWVACYFSLKGEIKVLRALIDSLAEKLAALASYISTLEERIYDLTKGKTRDS